jgi:TPP-dependent pyruvate/acetoin dehydrogenase alpha subunit
LVSDRVEHENPLVPNAKLRQMYVAMAEARALDEHVARVQKKMTKTRRRLDSIRGQEACRVSTAIDLGPGDLVSDSQEGVVMELLAGAKVASLLKRVEVIRSGKKSQETKAEGESARLLPWIDEADVRLGMALGAALGFKTLGRPNVVVAYVRHGEVAKAVWKRLLGLASRLELPVIFVVLPAIKGAKGKNTTGRDGSLSTRTARWGVPGIPVDAGDAVALYRVAQESMGRTRGGDGPVLVECMDYRIEGGGASGKSAPVDRPDPLVQMGEFLLRRKLCTRRWLEGADRRVRRQIASKGARR